MSERKNQRRPPERLAPPPEIVLLDEISSRLDELNKTLRAQAPRGVSMDWRQTVTYAQPWYLDFLKEKPNRPLFRVEIINHGPGSVHARVAVKNESSYEITVDDEEQIPVDARTAVIENIDLRTDQGQSADVKVVGEY